MACWGSYEYSDLEFPLFEIPTSLSRAEPRNLHLVPVIQDALARCHLTTKNHLVDHMLPPLGVTGQSMFNQFNGIDKYLCEEIA